MICEAQCNLWRVVFGVVNKTATCRLHAYPVLYAKQGEYVVQFKFTVLILPSGPTRITGIALDLDAVRSDKTVNSELHEILAQSTKVKLDVLQGNTRRTEKEKEDPQESTGENQFDVAIQ